MVPMHLKVLFLKPNRRFAFRRQDQTTTLNSIKHNINQ